MQTPWWGATGGSGLRVTGALASPAADELQSDKYLSENAFLLNFEKKGYEILNQTINK